MVQWPMAFFRLYSFLSILFISLLPWQHANTTIRFFAFLLFASFVFSLGLAFPCLSASCCPHCLRCLRCHCPSARVHPLCASVLLDRDLLRGLHSPPRRLLPRPSLWHPRLCVLLKLLCMVPQLPQQTNRRTFAGQPAPDHSRKLPLPLLRPLAGGMENIVATLRAVDAAAKRSLLTQTQNQAQNQAASIPLPLSPSRPASPPSSTPPTPPVPRIQDAHGLKQANATLAAGGYDLEHPVESSGRAHGSDVSQLCSPAREDYLSPARRESPAETMSESWYTPPSPPAISWPSTDRRQDTQPPSTGWASTDRQQNLQSLPTGWTSKDRQHDVRPLPTGWASTDRQHDLQPSPANWASTDRAAQHDLQPSPSSWASTDRAAPVSTAWMSTDRSQKRELTPSWPSMDQPYDMEWDVHHDTEASCSPQDNWCQRLEHRSFL